MNETEDNNRVERRSVIPEEKEIVGSLCSRDGLARYILECYQDEHDPRSISLMLHPPLPLFRPKLPILHFCRLFSSLSSTIYITLHPMPAPSYHHRLHFVCPSPSLNPPRRLQLPNIALHPLPQPAQLHKQQHTYIVERFLSTYNHESGD